ncbi:MAG: GerW family sporulation protein [Oscillospiraceae bacterium]|nr:GerW family sporulation protein [Oscillospiraceae bacterium]
MEKNRTSELMETVMNKVREMVDVSSAVGEPIVIGDGTTIIPVSRVSFGFASGGSDFTGKNQNGQSSPFGGGSGAGVKINPVCFVVIRDGHVRVMNIEAPAATTLERLIDSAPDLIDKVSGMVSKKNDTPADTEA